MTTVATPTVLQLGCGIRPLGNALNHDMRRHHDYVDTTHDLDVFPWPWADEQFEKIIALDVMEHLKCEVAEWLDECWRILRPDGLLVLRLPAWDHECGHRDPTHQRWFHELTLDYFDPSKDLWREYGSLYFPDGPWFTVLSVERLDARANLGYILQKRERPEVPS